MRISLSPHIAKPTTVKCVPVAPVILSVQMKRSVWSRKALLFDLWLRERIESSVSETAALYIGCSPGILALVHLLSIFLAHGPGARAGRIKPPGHYKNPGLHPSTSEALCNEGPTVLNFGIDAGPRNPDRQSVITCFA